MADVGITYGSSNQADLPPLDLPSLPPPKPQPLKLDISPKSTSEAKEWDSWEDAPAAPSTVAKTPEAQQVSKPYSGSKEWDAWEDAPPPPKTHPSTAEDIDRTILTNALPTALVGRVNYPADIMNLAVKGGQWAANKSGLVKAIAGRDMTEEEYNKMMSNNALFGSADIANAGLNAVGIEPYEPQYNTSKVLNTVATTVLGRKPVGAPALSIPQALSMGAGAGVGQVVAPDSGVSPIIGGVAGLALHGPSAMGFKAARQAANKAGFGKTTMTLPGGIDVTQGQMQQAAKNISDAADNQGKLIKDLQGQNEMVPGSIPTMAEVSPDYGIAQYQDTARTAGPAVFQKRYDEQNLARGSALQGIRGEGSPQTVGEYFSNMLSRNDSAAASDVTGLEQNAALKGGAIGKYGQIPESGASADVVLNAQAVRAEAERAAWGFMDKYAKSPADLNTARIGAQRLAESASEYGSVPLASVEKEIVKDLLTKSASAEDTFGALKRFRSRIGEAQKEVGFNSIPGRRLAGLKAAIDKAIENTVNGIVSAEAKAVSEGKLELQNTLESQLSKEREGFYAKRASASRENNGKGGTGNAKGGSKSFPGIVGAKVSVNGGSGGAKGGESVSPRFGEKQKQQYTAARTLTFKNKVISELETSGIVNPDGSINPVKYDRWYAKRRSTFKNNTEFKNELKDWRDAQEAVDTARAEKDAAEKASQKSRLQKMINNDPVNEVGRIFGSTTVDQVKEFADLVNKVKSDPQALAGLRATVGDYILERIAKADVGEVEGVKTTSIKQPEVLRQFIKRHKNALREVYGSGQALQDLEAVANDIKRSNDMYARMKIRGQSNTAKDLANLGKHQPKSLLGKIAEKAVIIGGLLGSLGGHTGGGILTGEILKDASHAFQSKGLTSIKAIEQEMLLHPTTFGRAMLEQVKVDEIPKPVLKRVAAVLLSTAPEAAVNTSQHYKREQR